MGDKYIYETRMEVRDYECDIEGIVNKEEAFSTKSRILDTVDSPNALVVWIFNSPVMLMHPLIISSPAFG